MYSLEAMPSQMVTYMLCIYIYISTWREMACKPCPLTRIGEKASRLSEAGDHN